MIELKCERMIDLSNIVERSLLLNDRLVKCEQLIDLSNIDWSLSKWFILTQRKWSIVVNRKQGVTKRCHLSWLLIEPKCWGVLQGLSQSVQTAVHRSPNKLWRSNSIFNLWSKWLIEWLFRQLCDSQGVNGFPTLIVYKDGKKVSSVFYKIRL